MITSEPERQVTGSATDVGRPLTVIIVTFRCRDLARDCLRSVSPQKLDRPMEIVVVDNDSRDGTVEMIAADFPGVRVIANSENVGFGRACNQALQIAAGNVLLLNPDTVLPPLALRDCLAELGRRPDVGMLGPQLVQSDGSIDHACRRAIPTPLSSLSYMLRLHRWLPSVQSAYLGASTDYDSESSVGAVNGAFMLVRREALDEVGYFDERFWMYGEDLDWCVRFADAGWDVFYWPQVHVLHQKGGSSGRARTYAVNREFHRAMWLFYSKHGASGHPLGLRAAVQAGISAKFAASVAASAVRRNRASWAAGPVTSATSGLGPVVPVATPLRVAVAFDAHSWAAPASSAAALALLSDATAQGTRVVLQRVCALESSQRVAALGRLRRDVGRCAPDIVVTMDSAAGRRAARLLRAAGNHVAVLGRDVSAVDLAADTPGAAAERLVADLAEFCGRPGAGRTDGPAVSVVCTVLDEEAGAVALVEGVGAQLRPGDELIVVDGGSRDATPQILAKLAVGRTDLRTISCPGTNISAGRNSGVAVAANPIVAFTDAGCTLTSGWLDGLRAPFGEQRPPGLVAGIPRVAARSALERAQAVSCYPDPDELVRPDLLSRAYTRVLGLGFDPRTPFARTLAVRRSIFNDVGGFPSHLPWVEDGAFGLTVAERDRCIVTRHAEVVWTQRPTLRATVRMYRNYGVGAARSGHRIFWSRDAARAVAYLGAAALTAAGARRWVAAAGLIYISLPTARAIRKRDATAAVLVPVAMISKDVGKVYGELCVALGRKVTTR